MVYNIHGPHVCVDTSESLAARLIWVCARVFHSTTALRLRRLPPLGLSQVVQACWGVAAIK